MKRIISTLVTMMISLGFVKTAHASEIIINSFGFHDKNGYSCVGLNSISMTESGNVAWKFKRYEYDSTCKTAKVTFAKTKPPKSIRGVFNLSKDGTFKDSFVIVATPKTTKIQIQILL